MFVWVDRDTFKIEGKLHLINFSNITLIAVYNAEPGYEIKAKFVDGNYYVGGTYSELAEAEAAFTNFINSRPSETKKKIKIT